MDRQLSFSKSMIIIAFIFALLFVSIFLLKAEPHILFSQPQLAQQSYWVYLACHGKILRQLSLKASKQL